MFKHASIYKITLPPMAVPSAVLGSAAVLAQFVPCGPSQERSVGWAPPRGQEFGPMVERIGDHLIMRLMIETKTVPTQAIKDRIEIWKQETELSTGRKPGKKETREQQEDIKLALLPMAFSHRAAVWVWIDAPAGIVVLDTASQARCDDVMTHLVRLMDGIIVRHPQFNVSPASLMTSWLHDQDNLSSNDRFGFDIGRACELKAHDESKAVVRYSRHSLDTEEVKQHILGGKGATKLALTYLDHVAFTLTDSGALTGINFLDVVFEQHASKADLASDRFDADVAIMTGELKPLIENLFLALDEEVDAEGGEA